MSATFTAASTGWLSALQSGPKRGLVFSRMIETDPKLVALGLKRRDPELLDLLIEQHQYRLYRYLVHLTGDRERAEDFFQETWIRVLERGHQYNVKWKFEAWLFTIARNLVIDWQRRKKPQSLDALMEPGENTVPFEPATLPEESPLQRAVQQQSETVLHTSLGGLPVVFREVLLLRFQEDMALEEIALVTSAPLSTVKSRLYRGLEALRKALPEGGV